MSPQMVAMDEATLAAQKRSAARGSALAAAGITLLKLITGLLTGSLGMLSEAAHSGIDLVAAAITYFSVRLSDKPADDDHTYGHGKVESLSAFVEMLLMVASSVWIITEAVSRLYHGGHELKLSVWPVVVLLLSIAVDWTRSRNLMRVARASGSQALEADALHFGTDIWSSAAVLVGLLLAFAGERYGIGWLKYADPVAALVVSVIIIWVSWRLAKETVDALLDRTSPEKRHAVMEAIARVPGVIEVQRVRMRQSGAKYFADVTVGVERNITFQQSEEVVRAVTEASQRVVPAIDVVVHTLPVASRAESVFDRIKAVAQRSGLAIHEVTVQEWPDGLHLEQHLELPETTTLHDAHEVVTRVEGEMRREVPEIASIVTHMESEGDTVEKPEAMHNALLETALRQMGKHWPSIEDVHDVRIRRVGDHVQVSCHCSMPDAMAMGDVHRVISEFETAFLRANPDVDGLLIHPEPASDNRR